MSDPSDQAAFIDGLIEGTESGEIRWQRTDLGYQAAGGSYIVKLRKEPDHSYVLITERLNGNIMREVRQTSQDREMAMRISYLAQLAESTATLAAPELRDVLRDLRGH